VSVDHLTDAPCVIVTGMCTDKKPVVGILKSG
jgi:hypothetical protein